MSDAPSTTTSSTSSTTIGMNENDSTTSTDQSNFAKQKMVASQGVAEHVKAVTGYLNEIRQIKEEMRQIHQQATTSNGTTSLSADAKVKLDELTNRGVALFMMIRALVTRRTAYDEGRSGLKTLLEQQRIAIDKANLKLQSLLYQKTHILKEIADCEALEVDDSMLMPIDEFVVSEGGYALPPNASENDLHRYHLDRLLHELESRKKYVYHIEIIIVYIILYLL